MMCVELKPQVFASRRLQRLRPGSASGSAVLTGGRVPHHATQTLGNVMATPAVWGLCIVCVGSGLSAKGESCKKHRQQLTHHFSPCSSFCFWYRLEVAFAQLPTQE